MALQQVGFAEKLCHESRIRFEVQCLRRCHLLHPGLVHEADAVGQYQGFLLVMRHVHHASAQFAMQAGYFKFHLLAQIAVQRAQRLIHQHDRGLVSQGACQSDTLLLPA